MNTRSTQLAAALAVLLLPALAAAQQATVRQGDVARWSGADAAECGFLGKRYPAVAGTCFYPVDMLADTGMHEVAIYGSDGARQLGALEVTERECEDMHVTLDDDRYVDLSEEDRARHAEERQRVLAALETRSGEARFSLPLAPPTEKMPRGDDDFCAVRTFNDSDVEGRHTGRDYEIAAGTDVEAPADGRVLLAEELFMTGNTVLIDHGAGLVSELFHLGEIKVAKGDEIERGQSVGSIGSTGRSTGPHLHLGFRWLDQRIDPADLLEAPDDLADLGTDGGRSVAGSDDADADNGGNGVE